MKKSEDYSMPGFHVDSPTTYLIDRSPNTIHHVGLSGGKDSTALWGWMLNESGIDPSMIRGTFADTQNEYPETYAQVEALSQIGIKAGAPPVETLPSVGFLKLAISEKRFPSSKARFCTEALKLLPCRIWCDAQRFKGIKVVGYTGVRASESEERSKMPPTGFNTYLGIEVIRPLLKWTIADVWASHKKWGMPINPLYFLGRRRVGCMLCCMSNKRDVRITAATRPEVIDQYREWELLVGKERGGAKIASFFPATHVPKQFRSETYKRKKDGKIFYVCTIDDVVKWAQTARGAKRLLTDAELAEDYKDDFNIDGGMTCKSAMGSCE